MLQRLVIRQFRNIAEAVVDLSPQTTLLLGANGQGKTSVLEAAYLILTKDHLRGSRISDVIQMGQDFSVVQAQLGENTRELRLLTEQGQAKKVFFENGVQKPFSQRRHLYPVVLFEPDDVRLLHGSPGRRREFLDQVGDQLEGHHLTRVRRYDKILRERNRLLAQVAEGVRFDPGLWRIYSEQLADQAAAIWRTRLQVISQLREPFLRHWQQLHTAPWQPSLQLEYKLEAALNDQADLAGLFLDELQRHQSRELRAGRTLIGPHLDELAVEREGVALRYQASRGELRSLSLALKLSQVELVTEAHHGQRPMLLLDDVMSELDAHHRGQIEQLLSDHQKIVTATERHFFSPAFLSGAQVGAMLAGEYQAEANHVT